MPLHFSAPHCRDVIEIRLGPGQPAVGCIRLDSDGYHLFRVAPDGLAFVGRFPSQHDARQAAARVFAGVR